MKKIVLLLTLISFCLALHAQRVVDHTVMGAFCDTTLVYKKSSFLQYGRPDKKRDNSFSIMLDIHRETLCDSLYTVNYKVLDERTNKIKQQGFHKDVRISKISYKDSFAYDLMVHDSTFRYLVLYIEPLFIWDSDSNDMARETDVVLDLMKAAL